MWAILTLLHGLCGAISIGAGSWVVFGILKKKFFNKGAVVFLRATLAASVTGLLLAARPFSATYLAAMSAGYISGVAVLALHKYRLAGVWALLFAMSTILVLWIEVQVAIAHLFEKLFSASHGVPLFIVESMIMLLFVAIKLVTVKTYYSSQVDSLPLKGAVSMHSNATS